MPLCPEPTSLPTQATPTWTFHNYLSPGPKIKRNFGGTSRTCFPCPKLVCPVSRTCPDVLDLSTVISPDRRVSDLSSRFWLIHHVSDLSAVFLTCPPSLRPVPMSAVSTPSSWLKWHSLACFTTIFHQTLAAPKRRKDRDDPSPVLAPTSRLVCIISSILADIQG